MQQGTIQTNPAAEISYFGDAVPDAMERVQRVFRESDGWTVALVRGESLTVSRNGAAMVTVRQFNDGKFRGMHACGSAVQTVVLLAMITAIEAAATCGDDIIDSSKMLASQAWFSGTSDYDEALDVAEGLGLIPPRIRFTEEALAAASVL